MVGLVAAGAVRVAVYLLVMRYVPLSGDEGFHWRNAQSWLSLVGWSAAPAEGASTAIVGNGWFLPGMSLLLTPARLISDSASVGRLWIGLLNFGLLCWAVIVAQRSIGRGAAWALIVGAGLIPEVVMFSFTFWGELLASWLAMLTLLVLGEREVSAGLRQAVHWVGWGFVIALVIFLRPSLILMLFAVAIIVIIRSGSARDRRPVASLLTVLVPIVVVVGLLLTPWTLAVSESRGGFYLTTTSFDLGLILAFGDPDEVRRIGAEGPGNQWHAWEAHLRSLADDPGTTLGQALDEERLRLLRGLTFGRYASAAQEHAREFLWPEATFLVRFGRLAGSSERALPDVSRALISQTGPFDAFSRVAWGVLLAGLGAILLLPFSPAATTMWVQMGVKAMAILTLVHPFTHDANARHHLVLIPWALAAIGAVAGRHGVQLARRSDLVESSWAHRLSLIAQTAFALAAVFVAWITVLA